MPYKDPEEKRRHEAEYREIHKERIREANRRWHERNREHVRARINAARAADPEKRRAYDRERYARKAEHIRAYFSQWWRGIRSEMIEAYGGSCACCGEKEADFLTLDHVGGGGGVERRKIGQRGNQRIISRLRKEGWPRDGYRLLCWNCQYGTQRPEGCPHQLGNVQ